MRAGAVAAVAAAVVVLLPIASASGSTRRERTSAAKAFTRRTLSFDAAQRAASPRAQQRLAERKAAAQRCLPAWSEAPLRLREDLGDVYFEYLSGALWSVDGPLMASWAHDVRTSRRVRRSPVLARAADALAADVRRSDLVYRAVPDACAVVERWQAAGWAPAARPPVLADLEAALEPLNGSVRDVRGEGAEQLARYARGGDAAAGVLNTGADEPDDRLTGGCDPVGQLVLPDAFPACDENGRPVGR